MPDEIEVESAAQIAREIMEQHFADDMHREAWLRGRLSEWATMTCIKEKVEVRDEVVAQACAIVRSDDWPDITTCCDLIEQISA